jgi:hypothetical protein
MNPAMGIQRHETATLLPELQLRPRSTLRVEGAIARVPELALATTSYQ